MSTKKNPLPGTQKGYKNRFTTCLLVPNVVEKKVFVIRKCRTYFEVGIRFRCSEDPVRVFENGYRVRRKYQRSIKIDAENFNKTSSSRGTREINVLRVCRRREFAVQTVFIIFFLTSKHDRYRQKHFVRKTVGRSEFGRDRRP